MEVEEALGILRTLSDGIDPVSGEIFPRESTYQRPEIIRALLKAVYSLEKLQEKTIRKRNLPGNIGKPQTEEEEKLLATEFDQGIQLKELSKKHERTIGGINARLFRLGKIDSPPLYATGQQERRTNSSQDIRYPKTP